MPWCPWCWRGVASARGKVVQDADTGRTLRDPPCRPHTHLRAAARGVCARCVRWEPTVRICPAHTLTSARPGPLDCPTATKTHLSRLAPHERRGTRCARSLLNRRSPFRVEGCNASASGRSPGGWMVALAQATCVGQTARTSTGCCRPVVRVMQSGRSLVRERRSGRQVRAYRRGGTQQRAASLSLPGQGTGHKTVGAADHLPTMG